MDSSTFGVAFYDDYWRNTWAQHVLKTKAYLDDEQLGHIYQTIVDRLGAPVQRVLDVGGGISRLAMPLAVSPKGGGVGDWEFSGNVIISEAPIKIDADKADPMMIAVKFDGTGDLTKAAIATT